MERKLFYEEVEKTIAGHIIESKVRPATNQEIEEAEIAYKNGKCPHTIIYDEDNYPYWIRTCHTCGEGLGTV